ncbi:MAG: phytanoyl-CoA dioxygenase family protein [bacterium]|nr:phytanoyl-CoA dioxygenase family protein [bacterium]
MIATDTTRKQVLDDVGYVVWKGLLDPDSDLLPLFEEYEQLIDEASARLQADGLISDRYTDLPLGQRVVRLTVETGGQIFRYTDICLPGARTTVDTPIHLGPAVFGLLANEKLLDAVETFIGPEILVHPVQHARMKPPQHLVPEDLYFNTMISRTVWHQDQSVVHEAGDGTDILTVWLPMTEATLETGCLLVVPGSHRGELILHCLDTPKTKGLHIPEDRVPPGAVPLEMAPGDVLFMHRRTVHSSLPKPERGFAMELRPALFTGRGAYRPGLGAQLRRPQPSRPGLRRG